MSNFFDTLFTVVVGTITTVARGVTSGISTLEDFFYVRFQGVAFIVLGARQTGKTTLIEWLQRNMTSIEGFEPDPTAAGGAAVDDFTARVDAGQTMKLKPTRDVGGEYAMWETDWVDLFREAQPRGILFMVDHAEPYLHKDALNFVLQMIEDEPNAARNLRAFMILVNKADLWNETHTVDDVLGYYRNEQKRLRGQAERLGYRVLYGHGSLATGRGIGEALARFFNALRPKPRAM